MKLKGALQGIGSFALSFIGVIVLIFLFIIVLKGGTWLSVKLYPWLHDISYIVIALCIFIFLPLCIFKKTRYFASSSLFYSSYFFGITLWMLGFILTYSLWGVIALVIGLFIMGIGVVPIAILATIFKGMWWEFGDLIFLAVLTFGARLFSLYLIGKSDERY